MYKVDLHTHSYASADGSLQLVDYEHMIESGGLDYIAITDHNRIDFAVEAYARLGEVIIVGEEITTSQGEIVGLFLREAVPAGLSLGEAAERIHAQGGLVYIPHPFETVRSGVSQAALDAIADEVDIVELYNGRALFQNRGDQAEVWARSHALPGAASSDAHGFVGWGNTYSEVERVPHPDTLKQVLQAARHHKRSVGMRGSLYPKLNRLRKGLQYA